MNGIHDMGGMQDMGPIRREQNEPVFHHSWEGRVHAINKSLFATGIWNLDAWRRQIELIPPAEYLRMSYYERWLRANETLLVAHGMATPAELRTGSPGSKPAQAVPALDAASAARSLGRGLLSSHDPTVPPRFKPGQRVRARNINPVGHTRLARYVRGKIGTIAIDHGVHTFPDSNALFLGERRQHVYSVRFTAHELWGEGASPHDSVNADMWDDYLEPA